MLPNSIPQGYWKLLCSTNWRSYPKSWLNSFRFCREIWHIKHWQLPCPTMQPCPVETECWKHVTHPAGVRNGSSPCANSEHYPFKFVNSINPDCVMLYSVHQFPQLKSWQVESNQFEPMLLLLWHLFVPGNPPQGSPSRLGSDSHACCVVLVRVLICGNWDEVVGWYGRDIVCTYLFSNTWNRRRPGMLALNFSEVARCSVIARLCVWMGFSYFDCDVACLLAIVSGSTSNANDEHSLWLVSWFGYVFRYGCWRWVICVCQYGVMPHLFI